MSCPLFNSHPPPIQFKLTLTSFEHLVFLQWTKQAAKKQSISKILRSVKCFLQPKIGKKSFISDKTSPWREREYST